MARNHWPKGQSQQAVTAICGKHEPLARYNLMTEQLPSSSRPRVSDESLCVRMRNDQSGTSLFHRVTASLHTGSISAIMRVRRTLITAPGLLLVALLLHSAADH